jgi:membrane protease YdiL (CAAX protease family)
MQPGPVDHFLAFLFGIVFPAIAIPHYARRREALRAGVPGIRMREYRDTILWLGGMGACTLAVWALAGRRWSRLGLEGQVSGPVITASVVILALALFFWIQTRWVRRDARARESVRAQVEQVDEFMPATGPELRAFHGVAVSAGIGEELFYRGFLLWYLGTMMPGLAAVVVSSLLFAIAHLMHGAAATWRAGLLGAAFCGLYVWTGTLWLPMLLHTAIDEFAGQAAFAARASGAASPES